MVVENEKKIEYLVVDTTAFIQNAPLQDVAANIITCQEVINEITSKRQLRRLVVLPYDLAVKEVFPENVQVVTEFAKKTGDYPSLSATDIKVMALTYQLEKEKVGTEHLRQEPLVKGTEVNVVSKTTASEVNPDITGFYLPGRAKKKNESNDECTNNDADETVVDSEKDSSKEVEALSEKFESLGVLKPKDDLPTTIEIDIDEILAPVDENKEKYASENDSDEDDDEAGWITPSNVSAAKRQVDSDLLKDVKVKVACMTTDFAMQNVLKQMNLNVSALDGRVIKRLKTFILRCYTCFKTTSIMTKKFCPKCGNNTLKRVAVSLDANGKLQIHINKKHPLTARGKKFSLPTIKGGKHSNNPILVEDQPMPDQRPSRLARTKNNPLDDDYIAGYSPFVMRDVNSKSAQLCIRPGSEIKHWMRKNPNEARRKQKK